LVQRKNLALRDGKDRTGWGIIKIRKHQGSQKRNQENSKNNKTGKKGKQEKEKLSKLKIGVLLKQER